MRVMSAGHGFEYLLKSVAAGDGDRKLGTPLTRYYTAEGTPPGTWLGSGLSGLGSDEAGRIATGDVVTEEQLSRLLGEGVDPLTGDKLGLGYGRYATQQQRGTSRAGALPEPVADVQGDEAVARIRAEVPQLAWRQPVAGFDFTFSPSKSVSALWAVSDAGTQLLIVQAHHAAMLDVLDFMEREVAATRAGKGGVARLGVRGLIATGFDHYDSRAGDPQLHTHLVVANKVQGADGKWRTLDSRGLHRATVALSETYNAYLADHTARLLGISWVPVDRGRDRNTGWEIAGIPTPLLDEFSRRTRGDATGREGIEAVTTRLTEDYRATHGRSPSARAVIRLRQQATLTTRPVKELHSLAELTADWRARATDALGQDATTWAQTFLTHSPVKVLLHAGDLTGQQINDLATVVLMEVGNKRAVWGRWNLHAEAARQTMGVRFVSTDDRERVLAAVVQRAEAGSLRLTPAYDRTSPAPFVEGGYSTFQPRDTIAYTSKAILDAETRLLALSRGQDGPRLSMRAVRRHIVGPDGRGVTLAEDQAAAIARLATSGRVLDLLVGPAGAGKTTALRALHTAWTATHGEGSVIGLAPSAVAADVLGDELGIRTENTAKFDYDHARGRWDLASGQLVLLDEASLAGTLALDRITAHAAEVGAKVVLIGDWAQLSAVETGGAFGMLVAARGDAPELTDVRRFSAGWEKTATLRLRHGDTTVLDVYVEHQRIHDGDTGTMLNAAYIAWRRDKTAGLSTVMVAATGQTVVELNQLARADLIAAGTVEPIGLPLHDGTTAGVGDEVVTRSNDRHLTTAHGRWVKDGDRWQVTGRFEDGSLAVRRLRRNGTPYGQAIVIPAGYVRAQVELGYATTVYRAQGSTVDTAHAILDPQTATRELLYVALTRGRTANHVYVPTDQPADVEHHHDKHGQEWDVRGVLEKVMARTSAAPTATETLHLTVAEHASLTQLVSEYETIAAYAQHDRWEALLESTGLSDSQLDRILDSGSWPRVEAAMRRGEANGYDVERLVRRIAPALNRHERPAATLAALLDRKTGQPRGGTHPATPHKVAGLIPIPQGKIPEDLRVALTEREHLITQAARIIAVNALKVAEPWTARLGPAPTETAQREAWLRAATTIRLYRELHHISGPVPLGNRDAITDSAQGHDYRTAQAAYQYARQLGGIEQPGRAMTRRPAAARDYGPSL